MASENVTGSVVGTTLDSQVLVIVVGVVIDKRDEFPPPGRAGIARPVISVTRRAFAIADITMFSVVNLTSATLCGTVRPLGRRAMFWIIHCIRRNHRKERQQPIHDWHVFKWKYDNARMTANERCFLD